MYKPDQAFTNKKNSTYPRKKHQPQQLVLIFSTILFLLQLMSQIDNILLQGIMRFGMAQTILDRGFEVSLLVANIEALTLVHVDEYALRLVQSIDGVGQLNLAAATWLLIFKNVKNLRCQ